MVSPTPLFSTTHTHTHIYKTHRIIIFYVTVQLFLPPPTMYCRSRILNPSFRRSTVDPVSSRWGWFSRLQPPGSKWSGLLYSKVCRRLKKSPEVPMTIYMGQTFNLTKYCRSKHLQILTIRQAATVDPCGVYEKRNMPSSLPTTIHVLTNGWRRYTRNNCIHSIIV